MTRSDRGARPRRYEAAIPGLGGADRRRGRRRRRRQLPRRRDDRDDRRLVARPARRHRRGVDRRCSWPATTTADRRLDADRRDRRNPNSPHRAEIGKVIVAAVGATARASRGRSWPPPRTRARADGRWLLILDTVTGSAAEAIYRDARLARDRRRAGLRAAARRDGRGPRRSSGRTSGERASGRSGRSLDRARFVQGLADVGRGRARHSPTAGDAARPDDDDPALPAGRRWRGHARGDRRGRRLDVAGRPRVRDPLGRPIDARWLRSDDGRRAVVEMAEASGLSRLTAGGTRSDRRDARSGPASCSAPRSMPARITSSSASVGVPRPTAARACSRASGAAIATPAGRPAASTARRASRSPATSTTRCSDRRGAAAVYGPQKGATPDDVAALDARNAAWADELEARDGPARARHAGAGAAGGVGFALLSRAGPVPRVLAAARRRAADGGDRLRRAPRARRPRHHRRGPDRRPDRVRQDGARRRRRAQAAGVPCIAVGGGVEPEGIEALAAVGAIACRSSSGRRRSRRRWRPGPSRSSAAASGSPVWYHSPDGRHRDRRDTVEARSRRSRPKAKAKRSARRSASSATRPRATQAAGALPARACRGSSSTRSTARYGRPDWERRLDPTSELILTILTQNSADMNAEVAFEALAPGLSGRAGRRGPQPGRGLGRGRAAGRGRRPTGRRSSSRRSPS